ncbi:MAG: hypothetical protein RR927_02750 [Victivallaceae bacterium]
MIQFGFWYRKYKKSFLSAVRLQLIFGVILITAGYKTSSRPKHRIQEKTVNYITIPSSIPEKKEVVNLSSSDLKVKTPTNPIQTKPSSTLSVCKKSDRKNTSINSIQEPLPINTPIVSKSTDTSNKAALKKLAKQLLDDSEKLIKSLDESASICSEIQKLTTKINISQTSLNNASAIMDIGNKIQNAVQLPYPGILQLRLEIDPANEKAVCVITQTDNPLNKDHVLKEISLISFREIIKKYNFQKKTVYYIKLIGENS